MNKITKHDTDSFEIYARGVKVGLDEFHEKFKEGLAQEVLTNPDDMHLAAVILDAYKDAVKRLLDGIDDGLNRHKNIKLKIGGTNE